MLRIAPEAENNGSCLTCWYVANRTATQSQQQRTEQRAEAASTATQEHEVYVYKKLNAAIIVMFNLRISHFAPLYSFALIPCQHI